MRTNWLSAVLCCLALTLVGCDGMGGRKPASTGLPYEVVLEGDSDSIVTRMMTADMPHLPQPEPMFSLIQVRKGKVRGSYQLVRNRIVVDINAHNKGYAVKMRKDVSAVPQTVVYIQAQSAEQLRHRLDGGKLRSLFDTSELRHLATVVPQNPDRQKEMRQRFGISMRIPASMNAGKQAKDFAWLTDNASTGMQSLIFFKTKSHGRSRDDLKAQADSALKRNLPGETDGMYMQLADMSQADKQGMRRGLWEMKGDAMGGPYVMRTRGSMAVIGFVYAPEKKKKILIKQLEAALSTIK